MLLRRFYDAGLAQASHLVGCQKTGTAIVIDANRDIGQYLAAAAEEHLSITHVTETHIHADFVSGSRDLAERAGAELLLSDEGGNDWRYAYAGSANARLLHDGDVIDVGQVRLQVIHTPGHTPEHIAFVITDLAATDKPMGVITGDFIFVGDVGRPDLLERAVQMSGTMEQAARALFASIQRFKQLPDYLQLWPGHGAGSACGKALGAVPATTLGYERIANWALSVDDETEFVRTVLEGQPEPPKYFAFMKRLNRDGPPSRRDVRVPRRANNAELEPVLASGAQIVDTRSAAAFAAQHIRGTINIPLNKSFNTWAGSLVSYERPLFLIVDDSMISAAAHALMLIGLDALAGYFNADVIDEWASGNAASHSTPQLTIAELEARIGASNAQIIDVRGRSEWLSGHIPGVRNIPLATLQDHLADLSRDQPIVVHCQGGGRSAIAASVLEASGFRDVSNVPAGFAGWAATHASSA